VAVEELEFLFEPTPGHRFELEIGPGLLLCLECEALLAFRWPAKSLASCCCQLLLLL